MRVMDNQMDKKMENEMEAGFGDWADYRPRN